MKTAGHTVRLTDPDRIASVVAIWSFPDVTRNLGKL